MMLDIRLIFEVYFRFLALIVLNQFRKYGSFEKGKKPGINLIYGIDKKQLKRYF